MNENNVYRIDNIVQLPFMSEDELAVLVLNATEPLLDSESIRYGELNATIPTHVIFHTYLDEVCQLDNPYNDQRWPIFSNRVIDAFLSLADFSHVRIPVEIVQKDGSVNYNYSILHLTTHCDLFDFENSVYNEFVPGSFVVEKAVLKIPEGEKIPPYFRLRLGSNYNQFVSAEAKVLLDSMGVIGINYYPLDEYFPA